MIYDPDKDVRDQTAQAVRAAAGEMTLDLFRRENGTQYMRLTLASVVRYPLLTHATLEMDGFTLAEIGRRLEIAAGAIAEHQCEQFGDRHDPSWYARHARSVWRDLMLRRGES